MSNGAVIWRGPSLLDGAPIVVIATGLGSRASRNEKTGGLIQTWIIREDVSPVDAVNSGADASVCGACPHRGEVIDGRNVGRSCYVTVFQAPLNVWKTYKRGGYPLVPWQDVAALFAGRGVRVGSYGDPAAVPVDFWTVALDRASYWTGYTHQWRTASVAFARLIMASCDSAEDRADAKAMGYRTFRVTPKGEAPAPREVTCPASEEAGNKTTCDACRACGGLSAKAKADIVIAIHGAAPKVNAFARRIAA
jgi:hypothetical protein